MNRESLRKEEAEGEKKAYLNNKRRTSEAEVEAAVEAEKEERMPLVLKTGWMRIKVKMDIQTAIILNHNRISCVRYHLKTQKIKNLKMLYGQ